MTAPANTVKDEDDDTSIGTGYAVLRLHPDGVTFAYLDFDDRPLPAVPKLTIACGQFEIHFSPAGSTATEHDTTFADRMATAALDFRDRIWALTGVDSPASLGNSDHLRPNVVGVHHG